MVVESTENASDLSTDSGSVVDDELLALGGCATGLKSSIPEGSRLPVFQAITALSTAAPSTSLEITENDCKQNHKGKSTNDEPVYMIKTASFSEEKNARRAHFFSSFSSSSDQASAF